jgi:AraC family transcriptional regulator
MHEQPLTAPQSIFKEALHPHPSRQLVLSSAQTDWPDLLAHHYHYLSDHTQLRIPALTEDTVIIHLHGTIQLSEKVAHPFQPHPVQPGDISIVPHHVPIEWAWTAAWEALHLYLPPMLLVKVATEALGVALLEVKLETRIGVSDSFIHQLGLALLAELQLGGLASSHYVISLTQALALHLLRNYVVFSRALPTRIVGLAPQVLRRVLDYIQSHLTHPLTQEEVSAIAHLSPFHFARLFKQSTGQSLHQYIITQRVAAAERLLLAGNLPLAEIALRVGFTDQSHLARHFKRHRGVTLMTFVKERMNVQHKRMNLQEIED